MKKRVQKWLALCMALALTLAVPVMAAEPVVDDQGYTVVTTAEELLAELENGTAKIRFGNSIDTSSMEANNLVLSSSLDLDLNGFTWTVKTPASENVPNTATGAPAINIYGGAKEVTIRNGTIQIPDEGYVAIWQYGGTLSLIDVTMNGGIVNAGGQIENIVRSEITLDLGSQDGYGAAALSVSGQVGTILQSTITGKGANVHGLSIWEGAEVDEIRVCTIIGENGTSSAGNQYPNWGIASSGTIGSIFMMDGDTISSIRGGEFVGYNGYAGISFNDGGEIGEIWNASIAGIFLQNGSIDTVANCEITSPGNGWSPIVVGREDTNDSGEIGWIGGCTITTAQTDSDPKGILLHKGEIGGIYNSTITVANDENSGGGVILSTSSATIELISGCTITAPEYAILNNKGAISDLGEDNTLTSTVGWGGHAANVQNRGSIHITATGTLGTVVTDTDWETAAFAAEDGWQAINLNWEGIITHDGPTPDVPDDEPDYNYPDYDYPDYNYPDYNYPDDDEDTEDTEDTEDEEPEVTTTTVTNPDGSTTTTVTDEAAGTVTETTVYENGVELEITTSGDGGREIDVTVPDDVERATVIIPVDQVTPGTVAVDSDGKVIQWSVPTEGGLAVTLDGSTGLTIRENGQTFADTENHWSKEAVEFVAARELFTGWNNAFAPEDPMTRAMLVTVLARLDGEEISGASWAELGMQWGVEKGITDGSNPDNNLTREQLVTLLYRYMGSPAVASDLSGFPDWGDVSDYAADAMAWAVQTGLITGKDGLLAPGADTKRAEVATILMRFVEYNS